LTYLKLKGLRLGFVLNFGSNLMCFCLRSTARLLAVIGWITAFVLIWYAVLTPEL